MITTIALMCIGGLLLTVGVFTGQLINFDKAMIVGFVGWSLVMVGIGTLICLY